MKLSFIIVHYNVAGYLRKCLQSIVKFAADVDYEVIVVDNASPDCSWQALIKEFPRFTFIKNTENEGFAKANNRAAAAANGQYLFILNPDTELTCECLTEILSFAASQPDFGALGLRMHNAEGEFLPESKRAVPDIASSFLKIFINFKQNRRKSYYRNDLEQQTVAQVEVLTGANLLILREVYLKIGGFDERYFMYGEDIDLCYSLLNLGFRNFYYGKFAILHHKGKSTTHDAAYRKRFYGAMQIFLDKYYREEKPVQHRILSAGLWLKERYENLKN